MKWSLLSVSIAGIAFASIIIFFPTPNLHGQGSYVTSISPISPRLQGSNLGNGQTPQNPIGNPIRLKIPRINIDAPIGPVGIMQDGAMEAPVGPRNVGWFRFGPRPGDVGSAVLAGHFGRWKTGEGSVFDNLGKLIKGDKIYIEDENGMVATFIVRELRTYDPNADASGVFASGDGKAHLNLITCEGIWDGIKKTYSNRLVVFADKEIE